MAGSWLRGVVGVSLTLCVAGQALAAEGKVTVFAAASLTNAMQDIAQAYKKEKNVEVVSSFASSSTLARQIEAGAPADLFISADQKWMDYAADKKAIDPATRATLLGNSLVVVAPKASAQGAITIDEKTDWTSLLKGGRLAVGDPQHVPAGIYAKEALQKLGAWETLSPKLAPAARCAGAGGAQRSAAGDCLWLRCRGQQGGESGRHLPGSLASESRVPAGDCRWAPQCGCERLL